MFDDDSALHEGETERERIVRFLRTEAFEVRDCFTRYSVYILMASGALAAGIARFMTASEAQLYVGPQLYLGLLGFFPTLFLFLILSMGAHKFGTSNRNLGYELHLQRTGHFLEQHDVCHQLMKTVGWEEAMRAWRFVNASLWAAIYRPSDFFGRRFLWLTIEPGIKSKINALAKADLDAKFLFWFDRQKSLKLLKESDYLRQRDKKPPKYKGVWYNAGGYLTTVILIFSVAILLCLSEPTVAALYASYQLMTAAGSLSFALNLFILIIYFAWILLLAGAWLNIVSRIKILETGLLSIHSCGITWEATILAHLCVLEELHFFDKDADKNKRSMHGYTEGIARMAAQISEEAANIHKWIGDARRALNENPNITVPPRRDNWS